MAYDFTQVVNATGVLQAPNSQLGGWFWFGILLMIFIIMILAMLNYGPELAVIAATFTSLSASIMLRYAQLVSWWGVLFFLGWFVMIIIYVYITSYRTNA